MLAWKLLLLQPARPILAIYHRCVMCPACNYENQVDGQWLDTEHTFLQYDTLCTMCRAEQVALSAGLPFTKTPHLEAQKRLIDNYLDSLDL